MSLASTRFEDTVGTDFFALLLNANDKCFFFFFFRRTRPRRRRAASSLPLSDPIDRESISINFNKCESSARRYGSGLRRRKEPSSSGYSYALCVKKKREENINKLRSPRGFTNYQNQRNRGNTGFGGKRNDGASSLGEDALTSGSGTSGYARRDGSSASPHRTPCPPRTRTGSLTPAAR